MKAVLIQIAAGVALLMAVYGAGHHMGARSVQIDWDNDKLARATATSAAIVHRTQENTATAAQQAATNTTITKVKNEELAPVIRTIYVDRVRVGPALCGGPAAPAQAADASRGDGVDSSSRLVRADLERDIRALKEAVERDLATGRACQAWARANGFADSAAP